MDNNSKNGGIGFLGIVLAVFFGLVLFAVIG